MSKWEMVKLSEITEVITKGTTPTTLGFSFQEEGINFVKIESISENGEFIRNKFEYISYECDEKLKRSRLQEHDILFSIAGALGRTAIVKREILPANTNQALSIIRLKRKNIFPRYIQLSLKSDAIFQQFQKQKQGVAQLNLSLKNIGDLEIPLPPIETQKQIAKTLEIAAELLAMRKQQLAELDNLIKSTFYEMFGDPVANEKGWGIKNLKEVTKFIQGTQVPLENQLFESNKNTIRFLRISDYTQETVDLRYITPTGKEFVCTPDDVIMVRYGASAGYVGCGYNGVIANNLFAICPQNNNLNKKYLLYFLCNEGINRVIVNSANQSAMPALSHKIMGTVRLMIPPLDLQTQFAVIVTKIEEQKTLVKKAIDETQYLFDSLMSEYFE